MDVIRGTKPSGRKCNRLLDVVVTIMKYKKSTIDQAISIKFLSSVTVSYLVLSSGGVLNITNNETAFSEIRRVFE